MGGRGMEEFRWKSTERSHLYKSQLSLNEAFRKVHFTEDAQITTLQSILDNILHIFDNLSI